ncbi:MAG: gamma-glutamylcyclotransferase [Actinobacteria bacterium]|nr:gamma-glutamylcyclotransferase [Actinomycetota bacterium]
MPDAVFVYGTLLPGHLRWPLLAPFATNHAPASVPGHLYDTGNGWPAARFTEGGDSVPGRWVAWAPVDAAVVLALLDEVEGPTFARIVVVTTAGPAWTYECRTVDPAWERIARWDGLAER